MAYTVKVIAELSGVSIRTLHHYDQIGLLKPEKISESGYRNYSDSDIEKLQQILFFRELEFSLKEIKTIINSPDFDRQQALIAQKVFLIEKKNRISELIKSIDKTINTLKGESIMTKKEMFEGFDETKMAEYKKEAKERWPQKYEESERKMANYSKADYEKIKNYQQQGVKRAASLMEKGPDDSQVQELMADNFNYINNTFYSCSPEMFKGLGQMYIDDQRFTAFYEKEKAGLAEFMRDAMKIYADNLLENRTRI